jgi:hypothetical protein
MPKSIVTCLRFIPLKKIDGGPMGASRRFFGLILLAFFGALMSAGGAGAFENEPQGYGGLIWGARLSEQKGMIFARLSREQEGMAVYRRTSEALDYGEATLESVEYEFWKDRLVRVTVRVKDLFNFILLRNALFDRFGKGRELSPRAERYLWEGAVTRMALLSNYDIS